LSAQASSESDQTSASGFDGCCGGENADAPHVVMTTLVHAMLVALNCHLPSR